MNRYRSTLSALLAVVVLIGLLAAPAQAQKRTRGLFAFVQLIHAVPDAGPVDVYLDDERVLDDFAFQTATPFVPVYCPNRCTRKVDIVAGSEADNSTPVFTADVGLEADVYYGAYAVGVLGLSVFDVLFVDDLRPNAITNDRVEYLIANGVPSDPVDIRSLDPTDFSVTGLLANNLPFGGVRGYYPTEPDLNLFQITSSDNVDTLGVVGFDLTAFAGQTLTLLGIPLDENTFTVLGFDADGNPIAALEKGEIAASPPATVRAAETIEPLAVEGNYPNPFNPTTTIRFDLTEPAWVRLEVIDLLGRTVMTKPAQRLEAGVGHAFDVDASTWASGLYLYRVTAQTATRTLTHTGRMSLLK